MSDLNIFDRTPNIIEESRNGLISYPIADDMMRDRKISLLGTVDDESVNSLIMQLLYLEKNAPGEEITFYINSGGGEVGNGLALYDVMQHISSPVHTICVGMAASMAAVILAGGDRRYLRPHAEVMIHQPSGGTSGRASDILVAADHIRQRKQVINQILSRRTGKPLEQVATDSERDYWMNPEDALSYGIVDEIIPET